MIFTIPEKVRWRKPIEKNPLEHYSSKQRRRLRQILNDEESVISSDILPVNAELTEWFENIYREFIGAKENAVVHDVAGTTLHNPEGGDYQILVLSEGGKRVGGAIFSVREDRLNMAYKVIPHAWSEKKYDASPSLYVDLLLCNQAEKLQKQYLSHGKDRNLYGKNTAIGLAAFKLSVGCIPYIPEEREFTTFDTAGENDDVLAFIAPENDSETITQAVLCCSKDTFQKYEQITKYPDQVSVEVILRD